MRKSVLEGVASEARVIPFSYLVQDLANGVTFGGSKQRCLMGEHHKIPKSQNGPWNRLASSNESGNCGRVVRYDKSIENYRGGMGKRFTPVYKIVKARALRVDLANPRIGRATKKWREQIMIDNRERSIPQRLFELFAPTAELGDVLDDRQDLRFDGWHNGGFNSEVGPEGAKNTKLPGCDDLEDN
jgi:hypothetical protein